MPDMTVNAATGVIYTADGKRFAPVATTVTISTADATNPRIDIIYVDSQGAISYLAGTPAASPVVPSVPTGGQKTYEINVAAGATSIAAANIVDRRKTLTGEAWITPTLLNGWTQFDAVNFPAGYYKDSSNIVHLRGNLSGGVSNTTAFALPAGYRPAKITYFVARGQSGIVYGNCGSIATYQICPSSPAYGTFVCLDGVTFRAEQ